MSVDAITRSWICRLVLAALVLLLPATFAADVDTDWGDWELGLFVGYGLPDTFERTGLADLEPENDLLGGGRVAFWTSPKLSVEASMQSFTTETGPATGAAHADFRSYRLNLLYNLRPGARLRPYVTGGVGWENYHIDGFLDGDGVSANAGVGVRWWIWRQLGARLDARMVGMDVDVPVDSMQMNLETSLGVFMIFGGDDPADEDEDGVRDKRDRCLGTPRGAEVDEFGCPIDSDGDGVPNGIDRCPDTPAGYTVDETGCSVDSDGDGVNEALDNCPDTPQGATVDNFGCPADSDGDGVYNGIDQCPDTPRGAAVDETGCPTDSDGDGVFDGIDKCPDTPAGAQVDGSGCPTDSDGDGVYDGIDECPDTPAGAEVDARGCVLLFEPERDELLLEGVEFAFNSDELTEAANAVLDGVAQGLKDWPDVNVEVAGHTDSVGNEGYNMSLSQRRAESVRAYLIGQGVDGARMTAKGYGETKPIADNGTEEGRDKNRRVSLRKM